MEHDQMVLGWISQHDADWLGMSAAVSGGWVMVMGEWANTAPGFGARVPWGHLLACLPAEGVGVAIEPADGPALASALRDDIGRREASEYCLRTRDRDVIAMRVWLMRIEEAIN